MFLNMVKQELQTKDLRQFQMIIILLSILVQALRKLKKKKNLKKYKEYNSISYSLSN